LVVKGHDGHPTWSDWSGVLVPVKAAARRRRRWVSRRGQRLARQWCFEVTQGKSRSAAARHDQARIGIETDACRSVIVKQAQHMITLRRRRELQLAFRTAFRQEDLFPFAGELQAAKTPTVRPFWCLGATGVDRTPKPRIKAIRPGGRSHQLNPLKVVLSLPFED